MLYMLLFIVGAPTSDLVTHMGKVTVVSGNLQPGIGVSRKATVTEGSNIAVYAIRTTERPKFLLRAKLDKLIKQAEVSTVSNAKGQYRLVLRKGQPYLIVAVIGYGMHHGFPKKSGQIIIDMTTH